MTAHGERMDWRDARELSFAAGASLADRSALLAAPLAVPLAEAIHRRLAETLVAENPIPHFASSAMDGWAVAGTGPWRIVDHREFAPGLATAIVTGGVIPRGATAVVRSEDALTLDDGRVDVREGNRPVSAGDNIRPAGQEAATGDVLISAGTRLNPAHIALAASAGRDELLVVRRATVTILLTGDEVIERGVPGSGVVRDSFGPTLPAIIRMLGGVVIGLRRVSDRIDEMVESIAAAAVSSDVIITTGSTGGSASDFLRKALGALGGELIVDGVAIRPGAPSMLATLPGGAHLVGLPGNPLAAMLGLSVLAAPLLAAAEGTPMPETTELRLDSAVLGKLGVTTLIPVRIVDGFAVPVDWRGSAMMRGFADASHIVACPPAGIDRGETATAVEVPWY